ncbi:hypothetical protein [Oceaniglobus roseus]|uniref:hypothetical protein n=1 Tax=Oceaniglobus roseus TaxID=1737570 RepID=UPI000C7F32C5|nr:hypothetical protein [Kandeliimicrobium roseum]
MPRHIADTPGTRTGTARLKNFLGRARREGPTPQTAELHRRPRRRDAALRLQRFLRVLRAEG